MLWLPRGCRLCQLDKCCLILARGSTRKHWNSPCLLRRSTARSEKSTWTGLSPSSSYEATRISDCSTGSDSCCDALPGSQLACFQVFQTHTLFAASPRELFLDRTVKQFISQPSDLETCYCSYSVYVPAPLLLGVLGSWEKPMALRRLPPPP